MCWSFVLAIVLIIGMHLFITHSYVGKNKAMRAAAQDAEHGPGHGKSIRSLSTRLPMPLARRLQLLAARSSV